MTHEQALLLYGPGYLSFAIRQHQECLEWALYHPDLRTEFYNGILWAEDSTGTLICEKGVEATPEALRAATKRLAMRLYVRRLLRRAIAWEG